MTGDGVNDAPALRQADIGIAMGIRGTDVAKESADMVIVDDSFATIVAAVEQGRIVVNNILRFIHYLLSCNLAEIMTVFVAIMVGWPLPLTVLQILWLNLVTDIFPATAMAIEPSAPDVMRQPPRPPGAPLLDLASWWRMTWRPRQARRGRSRSARSGHPLRPARAHGRRPRTPARGREGGPGRGAGAAP